MVAHVITGRIADGVTDEGREADDGHARRAEKGAAEDEGATPAESELARVGEDADHGLHEEAGDGAGRGEDDGDVGIAHLELLSEQRRADGELDRVDELDAGEGEAEEEEPRGVLDGAPHAQRPLLVHTDEVGIVDSVDAALRGAPVAHGSLI